MSKIDVCTKAYMSNPRFFSDAFNYYFFQGRQVVKAEELSVQDITELALPYGEGEESVIIPAQKYRDILKLWTVMTNEDATFMLLGIENQTNVHYAMPIRNMLYDALNYSSQVEKIGKEHRRRKDTKQDEFLSGFKKQDKVKPVFTLVIYWGTKDWDGPKSLYEMMDIKDEMKEIVHRYVNDYKLHLIIPSEIENFEYFSTELGFCFRYIQSSTSKVKLKKLLHDFGGVYSRLDKVSGELIQVVTNTKLPKEAKKEESVDMCQAIKEMMEDARMEGIEETAKSTARNLLENGADLELVIKSVTALKREEIVAIYEEINSKK